MSRRHGTLAGCLALAALSACGSAGGSPGSASPAAPAVTATPNAAGDALEATIGGNDDLDFVPKVVTTKAGRLSLTLDVTGEIPHDLVIDGIKGARLARVDGRKSGTLTVNVSPGTYTLICTLHSDMRGTLVVTR